MDKIEVSQRAVLVRVRRRLKANGERLSRRGGRTYRVAGAIAQQFASVEQLARELGLVAAHEVVV